MRESNTLTTPPALPELRAPWRAQALAAVRDELTAHRRTWPPDAVDRAPYHVQVSVARREAELRDAAAVMAAVTADPQCSLDGLLRVLLREALLGMTGARRDDFLRRAASYVRARSRL